MEARKEAKSIGCALGGLVLKKEGGVRKGKTRLTLPHQKDLREGKTEWGGGGGWPSRLAPLRGKSRKASIRYYNRGRLVVKSGVSWGDRKRKG